MKDPLKKGRDSKPKNYVYWTKDMIPVYAGNVDPFHHGLQKYENRASHDGIFHMISEVDHFHSSNGTSKESFIEQN
ncbi:hypothetical protein L0156_14690 [bacterium]|nr:hypothetical protein [bacterium]